MAKRKTNSRIKKVQKQVLDLRKVNPRGRLDVLAFNAVERFVQSVPELRPIVEEHKEVIQAACNHHLGPNVVGFDLVALMEAAQPFMPLLGSIAQSVLSKYQQRSGEPKPGVAA